METKISQKNEDNSNTLSIIDEPITNEKNTNNRIQPNNENIPIKIKKYFNTAEEFYSYNYPEYKIFKIGRILFCKMGNLITFNFDKNNNFKPKFSIGPNWYMTLTLIITIFIISSIIYCFILKKLHVIFKIIFLTFQLIAIFCVLRTALIHTEIVMNKFQDQFNNMCCDKCKIYYNSFDKVEHCSICNVCYYKLDHHCVWVGKCVGKDNICAFIEMIIFGAAFYLFLIACVIIYSMK
jgi:hypothetical protein